MSRRYLVIGAGLAGDTASAVLRETDPDGHVVLVGEEPTPFYTRIRLPEFVAGRIEKPRLVLHDEAWYREKGVELRLGTRVEGLDPKAGKAVLRGGETISYDACLLATGARSFVPPFPGADRPGVLTVRTVEDAAILRERAARGGSVVAVGGGLLGLEMAFALLGVAETVVVVEVFPWLLPRQLDAEGGRLLQSLLEQRGLAFRLDATVQTVEGTDAVEAVRLEGGEALPAGAVLVSAGVRARTDLAVEAGIDVDKGVVIDDGTSTSASGVYAAGDCAEHRGRVYGFWPAAEQQAKVAGAVMAGGEASYEGTVPSHTLKVTGIDVFSAGDIDAEGKRASEVERREGVYRKFVRDENGRLVGAVMVGDVSGRRDAQREIEGGEEGSG